MYELHPLRALFPNLSDDDAMARLNGVVPMSKREIDAAVATPAFQDLPPDRRAALIALWSHQCLPGSNQHKRLLNPATPRAAAEVAQAAIRRAAA